MDKTSLDDKIGIYWVRLHEIDHFNDLSIFGSQCIYQTNIIYNKNRINRRRMMLLCLIYKFFKKLDL